jgi:hypothetical protein
MTNTNANSPRAGYIRPVLMKLPQHGDYLPPDPHLMAD